MFRERAFNVGLAAPKALNNLPVHIRSAVNTDTQRRLYRLYPNIE